MLRSLLSIIIFFATFSTFAQIVNIPDPNFKAELVNYTFPTIDLNGDGEIQVSEAEAIVLEFSILGITNADILDLTGLEAFVNLKSLQINNTQITSLDLSDLDQLVTLRMYDNDLMSSLTGLDSPDMDELQLTSHSLATLDISNLVNLRFFLFNGLEDNALLTSISIPITDTLLTFNLRRTLLESIDLSNYVNLEYLNLAFGNFSDINISNITDLYFIDVGINNLTDIDVSQNTGLEIFGGFQNEFINVDLSNNSNLESVGIGNNPNLFSVNLKNGNNTNISGLNLVGSTNLEFICVDNIDYAIENFTNIEPQVTFIEDCTLTEDCFLAVDENLAQIINLFPNPTNNLLKIQSNSTINDIVIYNALGQIINGINVSEDKKQIDVSVLANGFYFLKVPSQFGEGVYQFIKE